MKTVNALVEKLYKEAGARIVERQKADPKLYKELLKNLIVQVSIEISNPFFSNLYISFELVLNLFSFLGFDKADGS